MQKIWEGITTQKEEKIGKEQKCRGWTCHFHSQAKMALGKVHMCQIYPYIRHLDKYTSASSFMHLHSEELDPSTISSLSYHVQNKQSEKYSG